jgi:adenosylhomocysteine nucleosidase
MGMHEVKGLRVLVTFAVEAEFAPWRKLRHFRSIDYDGLRLWRTQAGDTDVTVLVTGVGTDASARAMGLMMQMADDDRHFDVCVSSGLAGALCNNLTPGDIVAPQSLIAKNAHADLPSDQLNVDPDLRKQALEAGAVAADCLLTTDQVLTKANEKKACSSRAQSVDMESFEIVKDAHAWGARGIVVRAISDSAEEDLPIDFNRTLSEQHHISIPKVLRELAKNPLALPALLRFGKQSRHAAERLAEFLDSYVQKIGNRHLREAPKVGAR